MKNPPVFVFPVSLQFYLSARHTHKQLLTLYNPYDFSVTFKVLCTAPHKFSVTDPEGVIAPQSCVDVAVRYTQPSATHCGMVEKFRISMSEKSSSQVVGKRDVPAKFILGEPENIVSDERPEDFQPMPIRPGGSFTKSTDQITCNHPSHTRYGTPSALIIIICSLCVVALLMPTSPIPPTPPSALSEMLPWQFKIQLSLHIQLVCAFVLGLLTTILLRI